MIFEILKRTFQELIVLTNFMTHKILSTQKWNWF